MSTSPPVVLNHNLNPEAFMWLWMKYVRGVNEKHHCTNCLRGWYGKKLNRSNDNLRNTPELILDERPVEAYEAIYICGVYKRGYPRTNYAHNLHAAILPKPGENDQFAFEDWNLEVRNGVFLPIPSKTDLPDRYQMLPDEYTTCRIFRWAVCFFSEEESR